MEHPSTQLKKIGVEPSKSLGQNFLINDHSLKAFEPLLSVSDRVLEIGPGLGAVSRFLLPRVKSLTLVEKDFRLAEALSTEFDDVIRADILKLPHAELQKRTINFVIGNLPFYVTTPILQKCVLEWNIEKMIFGVQREFAERILLRSANSLAVFLTQCAEIRKVSPLPSGGFHPRPKVEADWLYLQRRESTVDLAKWEMLCRAAFWGKRKKLGNTLLKNPFWAEENRVRHWVDKLRQHKSSPPVDFNRRAEELSPEEFLELYAWLED